MIAFEQNLYLATTDNLLSYSLSRFTTKIFVMEDLIIKGTTKTPEVSFLTADRKLTLSGRSIPENSIQFYEPLLTWANSFCSEDPGHIEVHIKLEYFNTSSSKCLMDLLKRIEHCDCDAEVFWYYEEEDEDMQEAGEDYAAIIQLPFKLVETTSEV